MFKRGVILIGIFILLFSFSVKASDLCPETAACIDEGLCGGVNVCRDYVCRSGEDRCAFCADGYQGIPPNCHICGQNGIEPGEDCEGNNLNDETCQRLGFAEGTLSCNNCKFDTSGCTDHYVFITQNTYTGNLGGLAGAHQKCRTEASNAGLEGWWKAWISVYTPAVGPGAREDVIQQYEARDFIKHYDINYKCTNGEVIANRWSDLIDGSLYSQIRCGPDGREIAGRSWIWTNTLGNGSVRDVYACDVGYNPFTYAGQYEVNRYGCLGINVENYDYQQNEQNEPVWQPIHWTDSRCFGCNTQARLYCFQQEFDGDADEIDCTHSYGFNNVGRWSKFYSCGLEECDTFHSEDYRGSYCCGDDERERAILGSVEGGTAYGCCIEGIHTCIDRNGVCQTGLEGINYYGTCSDSKDNDCDGLIDDEDPNCESRVTLTVTNNNLCDYQTQSFGINFKNRGNDVVEVSITDQIYNSNNQLINTKDKHCEGVNAGESCIDSYPLNLNVEIYYHNIVAVYADDQRITKNNYNSFNVLTNDNVACCADTGVAPVAGQVCCISGRREPLDYLTVGSGRCGCPTNLNWDEDYDNRDGTFGACRFPRAPCYPIIDVCNVNPIQNFAQWLITPGCFRNFLGVRGSNPPYQRACCPYTIGGDYGDIWDFDLPDSLIEVY